MKKFSATYEKVTSERAIVELTDERGHWAGTQRVDRPRAGKLYEAAFKAAEQAAALKGGRLERFSRS